MPAVSLRVGSADARSSLATLSDVVAIPGGAFADPGFPPPTQSVYDASRRHPWVALPDDLERIG